MYRIKMPAILMAVAFFGLASVYSVVTPIFESPDELWHYPMVWHLARTGQLPVQDAANPQLWHQEGSQPPLYYALAALLTAGIPTDDLPTLIYRNPHADIGVARPDGNANIVVHTPREDWPWHGAVLAIHVARLFSVLLGLGTVITVYALGRLLWPERRALALLAMGFVAFNPMFVFIAGSVNNDNLITFLATLTLWSLLALLIYHPQRPKWWHFAGLGLLVGLAALSKVSGVGLLGLVGLTVLLWGWNQRSWAIAIGGNVIMTLTALSIAGWWYVRNYVLYGDFTGTSVMVQMMGGRPVPPTLMQLWTEVPGLVRSFWGVFGYFSILLPTPIYMTLNVMLALGLGGIIIALFWQEVPIRLKQTWPILAGWFVILLLGLIQWTMQTPATQGRLLFPAMAPIALFWAFGWLALFRWRWSQVVPVVGLAVLAMWIPGEVIRPAYAPPPVVETVPATAQPINVTFEGTVSLLAYDQPRTTARPGDTIPLTLYWQAHQPLSDDYTVFIHLVDSYGLIVAQRDVWPGPGVYPTSQWTPGQIIADTYAIPVERTAYAPADVHVVVGLYDHTTGQRLTTSQANDSAQFGALRLESHPGTVPNPQYLEFEQGITLIGYNFNRQNLSISGTVVVTLYWYSNYQPAENYKVFVHLIHPDGSRSGQHDSEPSPPTSTWIAGQYITTTHALQIANTAIAGPHSVVVGLYNGETGQRLSLRHNDGAPIQADAIALGGIYVPPPKEDTYGD